MEEFKDINTTVGRNLLKLRKEKKLTQMEVAEKFNYSDKSISKWEKGESLPSLEILKELSSFYGVTLDQLTSEEMNTENVEQPKKSNSKKERTPRMFSTKIMICLLSVGAVWLLATVLFVLLKLLIDTNYFMCFVWALPVSFIVLIVFNAIWGRMRYFFPCVTLLLWTLLASIHIQFLPTGHNIWPIYVLGIPIQILIILWGALVKKPKGYYKNKQKTENIQDEK